MIPNYEYKPKLYFAATFSITYTFWFVGAYLSHQDNNSGNYMVFMLFGLMAPFLLAALMVMASPNSAKKEDFLNRLFNLRLIQPKMILFILFLMPLSVLASIVISLPFGGSVAQFQPAEGFSFSAGVIPVLFLLILTACFEELGWRGYAFDSLQSRYSVLKASVLFGLLWSLWHFPLIFVHNSYQYEIYHQSIWFAVNFFVSIVPMGVIISWVCLKNQKSIISAILFHFIINMSQELFAVSQTTKCLETFVLAVVAAVIVFVDKELFFAKNANSTNSTKQNRPVLKMI